MTFTVVVEKLDRTRWRLARELVYRSSFCGDIVVPRGFVTDFASVPRMPIVFSLFGNRGHAAAVVHDWLYQTHPVGVRKVDADYVFREALVEEGVKPWRAEAMYLAVKFCGGSAWTTGPARKLENVVERLYGGKDDGEAR